ALEMHKKVKIMMIEKKQGKIINIAAVAGFGGTPPYMQTIGYNTSKGAVMTFTKDLAVKWGQYGINVNAIAQGFFPTKMSKVLVEHAGDHILQNTALERLGSDSDLQWSALFLVSRAAGNVSVDG